MTGFDIEKRGPVRIVRIDGGPLSVFGRDMALQLYDLVNTLDADPSIDAVVFTGAHPDRFIGGADVGWLQAEGAASPSLGRRGASTVIRIARAAARVRILEPLWRRTPLWGPIQLGRVHKTFLRMNRSGITFVAAINGSTLGLGAELAWACDVRVMADGDFFIGHPEVLLGAMPGGGGTQRLAHLIGPHKALLAMLEGRPFSPAEALANGAVDYVVPHEEVVEKAAELAARFGARAKGSVGTIKRAVYFGGSEPLARGLDVEGAEFFTRIPTDESQGIMRSYLETMEASREIPFYTPGAYERGLDAGDMSRGSGTR
jgi:enoyl-CoA hydratase/carnithine racemase